MSFKQFKTSLERKHKQKKVEKKPCFRSVDPEAVYQLLEKNIDLTDNYSLQHAISAIVEWQLQNYEDKLSDDDLLSDLLEFVLTNLQQEGITTKLPKKYIYDASPKQRRMDGLSRLLSVHRDHTLCIAVAFVNDCLIIASNTGKQDNDALLNNFMDKKLAIIQAFLRLFVQENNLTPANLMDDVADVKFSKEANVLAQQYVAKIIDKDCGGVGIITTKKSATKKRLCKDLLKITKDFLLGIYSDNKLGLTNLEQEALFAKKFYFYSQCQIIKDINLKHYAIHAEQAIVLFLKIHGSKVASNKIHIGISKLCCATCFKVLLRYAESISFRGTSNVLFPKVADIDRNIQPSNSYKFDRTLEDLLAENSESEIEIYPPLTDDEIPTFYEILTASTTQNMDKNDMMSPNRIGFGFFEKNNIAPTQLTIEPPEIK